MPAKPAKAVASISSKTARNLPLSKLLRALPSPPTTRSRRFSKTAKSSETKLSRKCAPSPLLTTPTMTPPDHFRHAVCWGRPWPARSRSCAAQFEALNFSRYRFRKLAAESHFARHFVGYEPRFDVVANFGRQFFRALNGASQYHVRHGIRKASLVGRANHPEISNFAARDARSIVIHYFYFVTGHGETAASWFTFSGNA